MRVPSYAVAAALAVGLLTAAGLAQGEPATQPRHRVVFEVTVQGREQWDAALNNIENLGTAFGAGNCEVEVVAHGPGLGMLLKRDNPVAERVQKIGSAGVTFAACQNTMKRKHVTAEDLLPGVITVDSGVAEVVRKQEAGWSYLKSGG